MKRLSTEPKISHAKAQSSQRFRANIRAMLNLILALLRETKIGAQRPRNLVALLNRYTFESQIARCKNLLASLNLLEIKADGSYPETGCCASKRIIAGKELSSFQQIQGGQQIDEEVVNGTKNISRKGAKLAKISCEHQSNAKPHLCVLAPLRETKIGTQRPRNLVALLNRSSIRESDRAL